MTAEKNREERAEERFDLLEETEDIIEDCDLDELRNVGELTAYFKRAWAFFKDEEEDADKMSRADAEVLCRIQSLYEAIHQTQAREPGKKEGVYEWDLLAFEAALLTLLKTVGQPVWMDAPVLWENTLVYDSDFERFVFHYDDFDAEFSDLSLWYYGNTMRELYGMDYGKNPDKLPGDLKRIERRYKNRYPAELSEPPQGCVPLLLMDPENLHKLCDADGCSLAELGEECGIALRTLLKWVAPRRFEEYAAQKKTTVEDLMTGAFRFNEDELDLFFEMKEEG